MSKKVAFVSLGCDKNTIDSEIMLTLMTDHGYEITKQDEEANVIVINTCAFILDAQEESINTIIEMGQYKETGKCEALIVTGCLAQRYADEIFNELPEVDAVIGTGSYEKIVEVMDEVLNRHKSQVRCTGVLEQRDLSYYRRTITTPGYFEYLKIAEGCDNRCTYCIIPQLRGAYRSRNKEDILQEAKDLAAEGVKELMVVAQDITRYGQDLGGDYRLPQLLHDLCQVEGIQWIRLLYAYPNNFTDELIEYIAQEEKICKYLDIPLQHADDEVLRRMNRKITVAEIKALIEKLRAKIPGITLRSTFIVGFPGESEEQYHNLLDFLEEMKLDCVGAFPYSREEGTAADRMDGHLEEGEKEKRAENLMELQYDTMYRKHETAIGQRRLVKVDELSPDIPGLLLCRSEGEAPDVDPWILVFEAEDHDP